MRTKACCLATAFALAAAAAAAPFEMVGWQFHDYNMPATKEAIALSPEYGINFIVLSHGLVRDAEDVLSDPRRAADLRELTALAAAQGIKTYLWLHELNDLPERFMHDGRALLDHLDLPAFLRRRYDGLFETMPSVAGIVMTLHESERRIFRGDEVVSDLPVPDRMLRVLQPVYEACRAAGKELIVRNFFYQPKEVEWFKEALPRLPDDVLVMGKTTPHEFMPFFPPDPMMGDVGAKRQIVEFDLGYEKAPTSECAYCQVAYIRKYIQIASSKGVTGVVGRCHVTGAQGFDKLGECNYFAFSRFAQDPNLPEEVVWREWASRRFPAKAVEAMISALSRTEEIAHRTKYTLGFWVRPLRGYHYAFGHIRLRSRYLWTRDEADRRMTELLMHPTPEIYERILAEKDRAMEMCKASLGDLEVAARYMKPEQVDPIRRRLLCSLDAAEVQRAASQAFWAFRLWINGREEYKDEVLAAFQRLRDLDGRPDRPWCRDWGTGHRYRIDRFIDELSDKMADPDAARAEDERIMREISYRLDPERRLTEPPPE